MAKKAAKSEVPTVERKVFFYRANCGLEESGKLLPFDPTAALKKIEAIPLDKRYATFTPGQLTLLWIDSLKPPFRIRIGNSRRSGLPSVEKGGVLKPLSITSDSGIAEQTHVVFFPDNIVGVEFNFYGPRPGRLAAYMLALAEGCFAELAFEALFRQDVAEKLKRFQDIRLFDLKIRRSYADTVAQADQDLGGAFKAAANAANAEELQIVMRPAPRSHKTLKASLLASAKKLLGNKGLQTEASRFIVKGLDRETERIEELDLLSDELVAKKKIILQDSRFRTLNSASAYSVIEEAYDELKDQLKQATGVST